jgi:hypothetical protein
MKNLFLSVLLFVSVSTIAQTDSIPYSRDFEFKEGIYLTIDQFKRNLPIPQSAIISTIPKTELNFLTLVLENKTVKYKDATGAEQEVPSATMWGYCRNRSVYLNFNKAFNRLNVIGKLCHFTAEIMVRAAYDPLYYNRGMNTSYNELRQFVLNTQTNTVREFNSESMEEFLKADPDLYAEFMKLKKRAKSDSIFIYLRKYNDKHPLYLLGN